jgi:RNA polymerase sigma-70 factor (ECF subfamily)
MVHPPIEELAERAAAGDRVAFDQLIRTQMTRLEKHVNHRLGARVRATIERDDVVQETVLKACTAVENFVWSGEEPFFRWLALIAEHVIWKASQKRRVKLALEPVADLRTTPATRVARSERSERLERALEGLERALEGLTDDHRDVILLTRIKGLPIAEVAVRMDRSPNAVKKLLARALDELRRGYGDSTGSLRMVSPMPFMGSPSDGWSPDE